MAYSDFSLDRVSQELGVRLARGVDLFGAVPPVEPDETLTRALAELGEMAVAVGTEAARREMLVAPVLYAVRRRLGDLVLFPGLALDVDRARGLNGFCDYVLARSDVGFVLTSPLLVVMEAKRDDVTAGLGQAAAAMVGMAQFNADRGTPIPVVYGAVTTGSVWRFLRLEAAVLSPDSREYFLTELPRVLGILEWMCRRQAGESADGV